MAGRTWIALFSWSGNHGRFDLHQIRTIHRPGLSDFPRWRAGRLESRDETYVSDFAVEGALGFGLTSAGELHRIDLETGEATAVGTFSPSPLIRQDNDGHLRGFHVAYDREHGLVFAQLGDGWQLFGPHGSPGPAISVEREQLQTWLGRVHGLDGLSLRGTIRRYVKLTLPDGSYRFRADLNSTQFWSATRPTTAPSSAAPRPRISVTIPVTITVEDTDGTSERRAAGLRVLRREPTPAITARPTQPARCSSPCR